MSPVRKAGVRLEMAEGRVQSIVNGGSVSSMLDEAIEEREIARAGLIGAVREATGVDPADIARWLAL